MVKTIGERADAIRGIAEIFREYGYEGASLARIAAATGLGKGSLYHFFPGGKEEMAEAVLEEIGSWFETEIYAPLREDADPDAAIKGMFKNVDAYFRSGRRTCLVGAFALDDARNRFGKIIHDYFAAWRDALAVALRRLGLKPKQAMAAAEDAVAAIQGALVAARAFDEPALFTRQLKRIEARLHPH